MNANYNSGSVKVTRRFSRGLSVNSSYTYSKSIDDSAGIRVQGNDILGPQNSYCIECERARSPFDVKHRFGTSVLYDLRVGKGSRLNIDNRFLGAIVGGWETGGFLTWQSGYPGTLGIGGVDNAETNDVGIGADRPNYTGVSPYSGTRTASGWLNRASFVEASPGHFGNVGRGTIEGPGLSNLDFQVHKQFRMPYHENHILQFRFEAFNVTNHPNLAMPNLNILAGAAQPGLPATDAHTGFGVITSTVTTMRQIQLGLKYSF
jgi:hypothetical protein